MNRPTFGATIPSPEWWQEEAANYAEHMSGSRAAYHQGRLTTALRLLTNAIPPQAPAGRITDFGCGDGVFAKFLARAGHQVLGLDIAPAMIELASKDAPAGTEFQTADAHTLADTGTCDGLASLNVLAYLTEEEHAAFWEAAQRIVRPGGWLLISHSNELFDLFALNAGTATFFQRNFDVDATGLLADAGQQNATYNVRANPLSYPGFLLDHGFREIDRAFFNYHPAPPALLGDGDTGRIVNPDRIAELPEWRQMLQCSTYFTLSLRQ